MSAREHDFALETLLYGLDERLKYQAFILTRR